MTSSLKAKEAYANASQAQTDITFAGICSDFAGQCIGRVQVWPSNNSNNQKGKKWVFECEGFPAARTHSLTHTLTITYSLTHTLTHNTLTTHSHTHTLTHSHTHTLTHSHSHTHNTHNHIHACPSLPPLPPLRLQIKRITWWFGKTWPSCATNTKSRKRECFGSCLGISFLLRCCFLVIHTYTQASQRTHTHTHSLSLNLIVAFVQCCLSDICGSTRQHASAFADGQRR